MANIFTKLFKKNEDNIKKEIDFEEKIQDNEEIEEVKKESTQEQESESDELKEVYTENVQENIDIPDQNISLDYVEKPKGFFEKLRSGLSKTSQGIKEKVNGVLANFRKIDDELFEELEEMLVISDIGVQSTQAIIESMKQKVKLRNIIDPEQIKILLKEEVRELLKENNSQLNLQTSPSIIMVVGVNGAGKTTSIGKIAHRLKSQGKKVIIAAGDTFRAAAIDQLEVWGKRVGIDIVKHNEGADPGAVIFDAIQSAIAKKADVLICDTAGRLHNKVNLMNELGKIQKIINRELPDSSKEVLLVVDATTGQNAVQQAKMFKETTDLTGIVLTKLDGTAKGGIIITIKSELGIPVKFIGVGEGIEDLQEFNSEDFVNALFE